MLVNLSIIKQLQHVIGEWTVDLNLIRVLDALSEEGNVTKAGARLGLSQSAVSHALNKMRLLFDD